MSKGVFSAHKRAPKFMPPKWCANIAPAAHATKSTKVSVSNLPLKRFDSWWKRGWGGRC